MQGSEFDVHVYGTVCQSSMKTELGLWTVAQTKVRRSHAIEQAITWQFTKINSGPGESRASLAKFAGDCLSLKVKNG